MNLIFIGAERSIDFVSYDFNESITKAFKYSDNLTIWDVDNNRRLLEVYCEEGDLNNIEEELINCGLFDSLPEARVTFDNIRNEYEERWRKRDEYYEDMELKQNIETYLKVKSMIDNGELSI